MSGFRVTEEFLTDNRIQLNQTIEPNQIIPNEPLQVTAYALNPALDVELRLTGNATGLPIPTPGTQPNDTIDATGAGGSETITFSSPQAVSTPYTASIFNTQGTRGRFLLEVNSEDTANNTAATAPQTGNLSGTQTFNGFVGRSDRQDWYNFRLASDDQVSLNLTGLQDNADLELYESNGTTLILRSQNGGTADESLNNVNLNAGNYLVKVVSNNTSANLQDGGAASTSYTLNLTQGTTGGGGGGGDTDPLTGVPVYRFFNTFAGTHFYTASETERNFVRDNLTGFNYEGAAFAASDGSSPQGTAVYRFLNNNNGTHFYTISAIEADFVRNNLTNYNYEGVAYQAFNQQAEDTVPLYRFFESTSGTHFYTASAQERDFVQQTLSNYTYEGVGYYVHDINDVTLV